MKFPAYLFAVMAFASTTNTNVVTLAEPTDLKDGVATVSIKIHGIDPVLNLDEKDIGIIHDSLVVIYNEAYKC